jgi:SAM-dependent methyltransferase
MDYDPIKDKLGRMLGSFPGGYRLLFSLLNRVFLRSWYVRRELRRQARSTHPVTILDAGTGFGQYTWFMRHLFPEADITAVDVKEEYLQRLGQYWKGHSLPPRLSVADLLELPFEEEFDLLLNVDVMEHIEDDRRVLRNFHKALRAGGLLLLHTPALAEDSPEQPESSFVGEHVRAGYRHSEIRTKLTEAGFSDIRITPTYRFWGGLAWSLLLQFPLWSLHQSRLWLPLLLVYWLIVFPIAQLLMAMEMVFGGKSGGCLLLTARKK